jgi:hypothetical protein
MKRSLGRKFWIINDKKNHKNVEKLKATSRAEGGARKGPQRAKKKGEMGPGGGFPYCPILK